MRLVTYTNMIQWAQTTTAGMEGSRHSILGNRINSGGFANTVPQGQQPIYGAVGGASGGTQGGGGGGGAGSGGGSGGSGGTGSGGSGGGGGTYGGQNHAPGTPSDDNFDSGVGGSGSGQSGGNGMSPGDINGRRGKNPKHRRGKPRPPRRPPSKC